MSLVYVDEDPWLREYENCQTLCSELAVLVESFISSQSGRTQAADIRLRLRQCDQQLAQLRNSLFVDDSDRFITTEERERRERCVEALYDRARHVREQLTSYKPGNDSVRDPNRDALFGASNSDVTNKGAGNIDPSDVEAYRQRQAQILEEQDRGLEALSQIIARQKNIAYTIDNEVTSQTDLVSNLADSMGRVGTRTEGATRRTAALVVRDNTCGYWTIAVLLFIAIIIVGVV